MIRGSGDGRGAEGELRAPGHADGARAARRRAVDAGHEVRRDRARLARPRPLRAVGRARVDAALLDALPDRVRPRARRPPRVPAVGLAHAGPPRVPPHQGRRDHDRSARPGLRATRSASRSRRSTCAAASAPRCATTTCSGSAATATSWRASATRPRRSPATCSSAGSCSSTTTTTSRSTAPPSSRTATTCRSASRRYGWHVVQLGEAAERPRRARGRAARRAWPRTDRPTLLVLRSHIGYPSPKVQDTAAAHGNPLGADEVAKVKEILGLPAEDFYVARRRPRAGTARRGAWRARARNGRNGASRGPPPTRSAPTSSTRASSGRPLARLGAEAADVARRARTIATRDAIEGGADRGRRPRARTVRRLGRPHRQHRHAGQEPRHVRRPTTRAAGCIHFGIREHGMGAAANGMAASGLLPCVGTFFVFSDYMRPAVRLAAIMQTKVVLRVDARLGRRRRGRPDAPADRAARVAAGDARPAGDPARRRQRGRGRVAASTSTATGPTALLLHPPEGPGARRHRRAGAGRRAARRVRARRRAPTRPTSCSSAPAPRSRCAVEAGATQLAARGIACAVVSMPSWDLFERQPDDYRMSVLPPDRPDARGRSGRAVRLGALRRRRREHRPVRCVGARRRRDARARHHPRARRRARARAARRRRNRRSCRWRARSRD